MTQNYVQLLSTDQLKDSRVPINDNITALRSMYSGTTFPTTNLVVGMCCFRSDQNKLYELKDTTPTWVLIADLTKTYLSKEAADGFYQPLDADLTALAALSSTGTVERTGTATFGVYTVTTAGKDLLDDGSATAQRTTLGLGTLAVLSSVTATELASNAVTTVKIADANVTKAKQANGTAGALQAYNSDATAGEVAPGTAGQVLTSNGAGNKPTFQDLAALFQKTYDSGDLSIVVAAGGTLAHGFGMVPKLVVGLLHCVSAEGGYATGDYIVVTTQHESTSGADARGISIFIDATNIGYRYGNQTFPFWLLNKTSGAAVSATLANWRYVIRAYA